MYDAVPNTVERVIMYDEGETMDMPGSLNGIKYVDLKFGS